jgi:hypothetical protein
MTSFPAMTSIIALWLPILLSAVIVFVASSIVHMALPWHKNDYRKLPEEDKFMEVVRPLAIPPGDYMVPRAGSMAAMKTPEFMEKWKKGPVAMMTVLPNGEINMGRSLVLWFLFSVIISFFSAYVAGRHLPAGTHYLKIFQMVGATTFMGYAMGLWQNSIWYGRSWATTMKSTIDSLIYAMLTAGTFGWLWPK